MKNLARKCLAFVLLLGFVVICSTARVATAATIFESGTLGPTGVTGEDVFNQVVSGGNVSSFSFVGSRFHIDFPVKVTEVGGHFVLAPSLSEGSFFGALVQLSGSDDFPDSANLSTQDVVGTTTLNIPKSSANVFGDLAATLQPGWYSVVFGSGLFDASGVGAALRNNAGVSDPDHIGFLLGFNWGDRPDDLHFTVLGEVIPEPATFVLAMNVCILVCISYRCR